METSDDAAQRRQPAHTSAEIAMFQAAPKTLSREQGVDRNRSEVFNISLALMNLWHVGVRDADQLVSRFREESRVWFVLRLAARREWQVPLSCLNARAPSWWPRNYCQACAFSFDGLR
jgi:hypothetical protein